MYQYKVKKFDRIIDGDTNSIYTRKGAFLLLSYL